MRHILPIYRGYWMFSHFQCSEKMQLPQNRIFHVIEAYLCHLSRLFYHFPISCVLEKCKFFKIEHFRANEWDSCHLSRVFRSLYAFQCLGTSERCSAGSQIFFLNKQSENCQTNDSLFKNHQCCDLWKIPLSKIMAILHKYTKSVRSSVMLWCF